MFNIEQKEDISNQFLIDDSITAITLSTNPFEITDDLLFPNTLSKLIKEAPSFKDQNLKNNTSDNLIHSHFVKNSIAHAKKDVDKYQNNPFTLNNLGVEYLSNKNYDKATECFSKALIYKKDYLIAKLNLARTSVLAGNFDKALTFYKSISSKTKDDTRVLINIGDIYLKTNKIQKATDYYIKVLKLDSKNVAVLNRMGIIELIKRRFNNAIKEFRSAIKIQENSPEIYNNLGVAYEAIGSIDKAKKAFKIALAINPTHSNTYLNLSFLLRKNGKVIDAINLLDGFVKQNSDDRVMEALARLYLDNHRPKKSISILSELIINAKKNGNNRDNIGRYYNNIAVAYHTENQFKDAEKCYLNSVEYSGFNNPIQINNIIDFYHDKGDFPLSKKYIDILSNKFMDDKKYYYKLARYNYSQLDIKLVIKNITKFIGLETKFAPAYCLLSFVYCEYKKDYKKAIDICLTGIESIPSDIGIINNLAYSYLMNDNIEDAKRILQNVEHIRSDIYLLATRGLLRIKEGNIDDGRILYGRAGKLAKKEVDIQNLKQKKNLELAKYYLIKSDYNKAMNHLNKISRIKFASVFDSQSKELRKELETNL